MQAAHCECDTPKMEESDEESAVTTLYYLYQCQATRFLFGNSLDPIKVLVLRLVQDTRPIEPLGMLRWSCLLQLTSLEKKQ